MCFSSQSRVVEQVVDFAALRIRGEIGEAMRLVPLERIHESDLEQMKHFFVQVEGQTVEVVQITSREIAHAAPRLFTRQVRRRDVW